MLTQRSTTKLKFVGLSTSFILRGVVLLGAPIHTSEVAAVQEEPCFKGSYSNSEYLYSIAVPAGLRCCIDPPPSPNHGCAISLPGKNGTNLWVSGSYDLDFNSPESALRYFAGRLLETGSTLTILRHEPSRLGEFEAVRLTLRITKPGAEPMIEDQVTALAARKGRGEIIYTVGMNGPASEYLRNSQFFSQIVASWKAESR